GDPAASSRARIFAGSEGSSGSGSASAFRPAISLAEGATERSFISNRYRAARAAVSANSSFMRTPKKDHPWLATGILSAPFQGESKILVPRFISGFGGCKHSARPWLLRKQPG